MDPTDEQLAPEPDFLEAAFLQHESEIRAVRHPIATCFDAHNAALKVLSVRPRLRRHFPQLEPPIPEHDMPRIERVFSLARAVLYLDGLCREAGTGASPHLGQDYAEGVRLRRKFRDAALTLSRCGVAAPALRAETRGAVGHLRLAEDLIGFVAFLRAGGEPLRQQAALKLEELCRAATLGRILLEGNGSDYARRSDLRLRRGLRRRALTLLCAAYQELRAVVLLRRHPHGDGERCVPVIFPRCKASGRRSHVA